MAAISEADGEAFTPTAVRNGRAVGPKSPRVEKRDLRPPGKLRSVSKKHVEGEASSILPFRSRGRILAELRVASSAFEKPTNKDK